MNNLNNLFPCLDSIIAHTHKIKYDIWVVAYLFSKENLQLLKEKYPSIHIIESNEIRGFSENNNLALRQAQGEYCFVLNDDTKFDTPVIDQLVESIEKTPDATIMSPKILNADGSVQWCGRPKRTFFTFLMNRFRLLDERKIISPHTNQKGLFQTYNIVGAAFLIKTDTFRELGFFDDYYFFCPEDIALSTLANERGYKCYVDESISLYHLEGGTASKLKSATWPAEIKGCVKFFSNGSFLKELILNCVIALDSFVRWIYWSVKSRKGDESSKIKALSFRNTIPVLFTKKTPKEIFIYYYNKIGRQANKR